MGIALLIQCIKRAKETGASDLHIYAGEKPHIRVHGVLEELSSLPAPEEEEIYAILEAVASKKLRERFFHEREIDFGCTVRIDDEEIRLRANAAICLDRTLLVFRLLAEHIPTLEELALPGTLREIAQQKSGLFLVTGRTGMGKSTTLAAIIEYINRLAQKHIVTVEDPVEYLFQPKLSRIHQREVGTDCVSFRVAIEKSLRQDIDLIMAGELRDLETIQAALTAAETGHLVLATLHTQNAAQSIERIVDVFPGGMQNQIRAQLSLTLRGILSQQLVPTTKGVRTAAFELLLATHAVRSCIRESKTTLLKNIMQTGAM